MEHTEKNISGGQISGMTAFVICSAFALFGAAVGCFAGSYADIGAAILPESGRDFGECLSLNMMAVGIALVLGFSALGIFLLPLLSAAGGFASGFILAALLPVMGSWGRLFVSIGWIVAAALPPFTVLCTVAMSVSASVLRALAVVLRSNGRQMLLFLKILLLSVLPAVLLAIAAAAARS